MVRSPSEAGRSNGLNQHPLLAVRGITVQAPDGKVILDRVDFASDRAELTAILGPSGSGKTTLLRAIAGLIPLDAGEVWIGETCLSRCQPETRRRMQREIGFVWQEGALAGRLTALTNVLCGRLNREQPWCEWLGHFSSAQRQNAFHALQRLRIGHLALRRADRMSGGERQRVGIARALHARPGILLADEPVASLDPRVAVEVLEDLVTLAGSERKLTLVSLHQVEFARRFADRVIALNQGKVVFDGPPSHFSEELLERIYAQPSKRVQPASQTSGGVQGANVPKSPAVEAGELPAVPVPPPAWRSPKWVLWAVAIALVYLVAVRTAHVNPAELARGIPSMISLAWRLLPPEWDWTATEVLGWSVPVPVVLASLLETVMMALLGTTGGALISLPLCLLAARNVSPHAALYRVTRLLLNANRAIPDIVFALIIVAAVGLGPFAGTLALAVASIGSISKVYAEVIQSADRLPVLALEATGAGRLFAVRYGLLPQALPVMLSYTLLYFEHNVRSATILGLVGAGGIGLLISKYLALFQYQKLSGAIVLVILTVTLLDRLSDHLRQRLV